VQEEPVQCHHATARWEVRPSTPAPAVLQEGPVRQGGRRLVSAAALDQGVEEDGANTALWTGTSVASFTRK